MSTEAAKTAAAAKPALAKPSSGGGGAGLLSRLSSFVIGAGVTAIGTQYLIFQDLHEGNKILLARQQAIEQRLAALERKN
jgi:hypothetical protein